MEKYRRWTDEKVGINPFVVANTRSTPLIGRLIKLPVQLVKLVILLSYLPIFIILYLIPVDLLRQKSARILLLILGVYQIQDYSLDKLNKKSNGHRVLSNHSCFIDIAYYLYKFPGCYFLAYSQDDQGKVRYYLVSAVKIFMQSLIKLQPFYTYNSNKGYESVNEALKQQLGGGKTAKLIIFYQKIRTNGRGTIKIDKSLCDQLYDLTQDYYIVQMTYSDKRDELFILTTSGLSVLWASLGTLIQGINLKIRATKQSIYQIIQDSSDTHSTNELRQAVFGMSVGPLVKIFLKQLQTSASSYFQFLQFFNKTQKQGYKLE